MAVATSGAPSSNINSSIVEILPSVAPSSSSLLLQSLDLSRNYQEVEGEKAKTNREAPSLSPTSSQQASESLEINKQEASREIPKLDSSKLVSSSPSSKSQPPIYTNQFVIQVEGGKEEARKLALKYGFVYLNHILGDYYHLEHRRLSKRSLNPSQDVLNISIQDEPQVSVYIFFSRCSPTLFSLLFSSSG